MSPETAQWLLTGAHAFQKEPKLTSWNNLSKENFISLLTSIFEAKNFTEAVRLLEQVVAGDLTAPSLPPDLKLLLEEWQESLAQKEEAHRIAREKVEKFLEEQRRLAVRKYPVLPLAGPTKPGIKPQPLPERTPPEAVFPQEIKERLAAEEEGVAFVPLYTLLHPKVAISFAKKIILSPVVKTLQVMDKIAGEELKGENVSEWREILHQGLTSEDIDTSIVAFEQAGVTPEEPKIKELEGKRIKTKAYEQKHWVLNKILKHYHEFSKITGRRQIFLPSIKTFLPRLTPLPVWVKKQGYAWKLRQGLNQIGFALRLHEKVSLAPGKTIIYFTLPDKITRIFTFGRVKSFGVAKSFLWQKTGGAILFRLGKTAFGKGVKRASAWLITKLGLAAGLAAIPTGVTQVIAFGLLALDVRKAVFGLFRGLLRRLSQKPLESLAIGASLIMAGLFLLIPLPLKFLFLGVGGLLTGIGLLAGATKLAAGVISGIGGFLGGAISIIGGLFSSLTTLSLPATLPLVVAVGIPTLIATLAIVTTIKIASPFSLAGTSRGEEIGPLPTVAPSPAGAYLAELLVYRLNNECGIERVNLSTWSNTKRCLETSSLTNKQIIISNFELSVFNNKSLQCVGFVAGIEQALGRNFPQDRNARDYLTRIPSGYQKINPADIQVGDIAIWFGVKYGHMAIVVRREGSEIVLAQAWGDDAGLDGRVNLTSTNIYDPDGFIRYAK